MEGGAPHSAPMRARRAPPLPPPPSFPPTRRPTPHPAASRTPPQSCYRRTNLLLPLQAATVPRATAKHSELLGLLDRCELRSARGQLVRPRRMNAQREETAEVRYLWLAAAAAAEDDDECAGRGCLRCLGW